MSAQQVILEFLSAYTDLAAVAVFLGLQNSQLIHFANVN
jgi:hypothetical protein